VNYQSDIRDHGIRRNRLKGWRSMKARPWPIAATTRTRRDSIRSLKV